MGPVIIKVTSQVEFIMPFAEVIARAMRHEQQILVVAGGAVRLGLKQHGLTTQTASTLQMQAAAGEGQLLMMAAWEGCMKELGISVAQLQYSHHVLDDPTNNIAEVIEQIWRWGRLPIANGLDTVTNEETVSTGKLSENAGISSRLAVLTKAEKLIMLGSQPYIYTHNPDIVLHAKPIFDVEHPDDSFLDQFPAEKAQNGSFGGNRCNVAACLYAAQRNVEVLVTKADPQFLERMLNGERLGTVFHPKVAVPISSSPFGC